MQNQSCQKRKPREKGRRRQDETIELWSLVVLLYNQAVAPVTTSWAWQYHEGLHYAIKGCLKVRLDII